jgi:hypothetical protein
LGCCTSTWTNAPVSFSSSQGAVVSQARKRTITSRHLTDWPGCSVTFCTIPLCLLRIPSVAMRCAIGVTPGALTLIGTAALEITGCEAFSSPPFPQPASRSAVSSGAASFLTSEPGTDN